MECHGPQGSGNTVVKPNERQARVIAVLASKGLSYGQAQQTYAQLIQKAAGRSRIRLLQTDEEPAAGDEFDCCR